MNREKKKKTFLSKLLTAVSFVLIIALAAAGVYVYSMLSSMRIDDDISWELDADDEMLIDEENSADPSMPAIDESLMQTPAPSAIAKTNEELGIINIAVFGMDNRYKYQIEGGRSDVNIILTIDTNTNEIRLTSFIRDMLVYVEELDDYNRINAAIVYADGPDGAVRCMEQEFNISIDNYMITNFVGMARIIDAIGGVTVHVPSSIINDANLSINEMNPIMGYKHDANLIHSSGTIRLNGIQAVAFMRQRKAEGGFTRDDNQKEVLSAIRSQLQNLSVQEVNGLLTVVTENIRTDMKPLELIEMTMHLYDYKDNGYTAVRFPLDDTYTLGRYQTMSVVQYDKDTNLPQLYDFIYNGINPTDND